jgi:chromate reductase
MRVLGLCGSLRRESINAAVLRVAAQLAAKDMVFRIYEGLGDLPLFNPDLEADLPAAARRLHAAVDGADALVIASPEYAHGVTGVTKNALDWLVGFGPFAGKPVAVWNAAPRAHHADDSLREILRTMSAVLVIEASVSIPLVGSRFDEAAILATPGAPTAIDAALGAIARHLAASRTR